MSSITFQVSVSDMKCQVSSITYQVPMSDNQVSYINSYSDVSCTKSHNSNYQACSNKRKVLAYHISTRIMRHHVLKSRIIIIKHVTMVIKYGATQEMYSPKIK